MDKLEHYLDRICRSIGGPKSLRQHVRQELREHLLDAVAEYKASGLPEEAALARALEDFGGPEQLRSELEATHGHRLMPLLIDKAMQWKERTMRAKWLWTTWAYLAVVLVIALELLFIAFNVVYIIPKMKKLMRDGIVDPAIIEKAGVSWMPGFLNRLSDVGGHYTTQLLLLAAAAWGLLEWRVKSENKPFIRLSVLGTVAVVLMVVIVFMAGSLVISFELGVPAVGGMIRPWAEQQIATIDSSLEGVEQALAKKDWEVVNDQTDHAASAMNRLSDGPALASLTRWNEPPSLEDLRSHTKAARESLAEAREAVRRKDAEGVRTALRKFHEAYEPLHQLAKASQH
jgi:hypothetical protein